MRLMPVVSAGQRSTSQSPWLERHMHRDKRHDNRGLEEFVFDKLVCA